MAKALLIAEKPSLMREIRAVYNKMGMKDEITFKALTGHVLELQEPDQYTEEWGQPWKATVLPMIPEAFKYIPTKRTYDLYKDVKDEMKSGKYDYIINACDAGREGELIFYSLYKTVGVKTPVKRYWATNPSEESVKKALSNLIDDKDPLLKNLKASAQYRAYFDWLIGMNFTRAITLSVGTTIRVGRVMTPTLAMIVKRELEIRDFRPETYFEVVQEYDKGYEGVWTDLEEKTSRIDSREEAQKTIDRAGKKGVVDEVTEKENLRKAPTLHSLLELQKDCNKVYGFTADKTLAIAQALYEDKKILTYPRTESRVLPNDMVKDIPNHIKCLSNVNEVSKHVKEILSNMDNVKKVLSSKDYVDDAKVTDHHAIIPTTTEPHLDSLSEDEKKVYMLVVKRFLAIFMKPLKTLNTTVITNVGGEKFVSKGKVILDPGYTVLFTEDSKDVVLPKLKKGDEVKVANSKILEKQTTPPSRYSDATLLDAMQYAGKEVSDAELRKVMKESAGLGTPATRAEIINKIIASEWVERKKKLFYATDKGISIIKALSGKSIISPELTAEWENKLRKIEEGELSPTDFYNDMINYIKTETDAYKVFKAEIAGDKKSIGACPKCGSDVLDGKNAYYCGEYRLGKCDFVISKNVMKVKISESIASTILKGEKTKEFEFTKKDGKTKFKAMLYLDTEKKLALAFNNDNSKKSNNESGSKTNSGSSVSKEIQEDLKDLKSDSEQVSLGKCPKCGAKVVEGNNFYLCSQYGEEKGKCTFNLKKIVKDGYISSENMSLMLNGKNSEPIEFKWTNGKNGYARLKYTNKLEFIFDK